MELRNKATFNSINRILYKDDFRCLSHHPYMIGCSGDIYDGMSGFWVNRKTQKVIYISTEAGGSYWGNTLIRSAKDQNDFFGGSNHFVSTSEDLRRMAAELTE